MTHALEKLGIQIEALQAQQEELASGSAEAAVSVRRLMTPLKASLGNLDCSEVLLGLVDQIPQAVERDLPLLVERLLEELRQRATQDNQQADYSLILVIDDDPIVRRIVERRLSSGSQRVVSAADLDQARKILEDSNVSLILLDLVLPGADGRDYLLELKAESRTRDIPVFFLSGKEGKSTQAECFALGGEAYFQKPFEPDVLSAAVRSALLRRQRAEGEARQDALTGLPNRKAFKESYDKALAFARRNKTSLSVAIIDLDHFKAVNDTHGHQAGDDVLRAASTVFRESLRQSDIVARWGGEEFVLLFHDTNVQGASTAVRKILATLRERKIQTTSGAALSVTFSAGVVEVGHETSVDDAVAEADTHLYRAKSSGRARVLSVHDDATLPKHTVLLVEDDLVTARIVSHRLTREDIDVVHATRGEQALSVLEEQSISLVLSDVMMPGMGGLELLSRIRNEAKYKSLPVVMLTSLGKAKDIDQALVLGADDYIVKPFSPVELISRVHRILLDAQA